MTSPGNFFTPPPLFLKFIHGSKNLKRFSAKYIDYPSVAVASTTLASELLNRIFGFYYLKVFLNVYNLDEKWLNVSQTLYLAWNAINDPIFGYMQDIGCCGMTWMMNRRKVILYGGPFYALFFMIPWIPWTNDGQPGWLVGLHLIASLFFYDGVLSLVLSAQCGLFTELTTQHSGRVRVIIYMEIAGLIGSFIILPVDAVSKSVSDFRTFRVCTSVVAMVSTVFFLYTGYFAKDDVAQNTDPSSSSTKKSCGVDDPCPEMTETRNDDVIVEDPTLAERVEKRDCSLTDNFFVSTLKEGWRSSKGIFTNRNFWCVVCGNFFHILRVTANNNFLAIYVESLVSLNGVLPIGTFGLSVYYTFCNFVPKLVVILCWPALKRFGAFNTLVVSSVLTIINTIVAYCIGRHNYISVLSFLLLENIFSSSIWPAVYNIFFPDVIDEDMKINKRSHPFSTTIFTLNALITKPANSLAPIVVVAVLNNYGYNAFQDYRKVLKQNYLDSSQDVRDGHDTTGLMAVMFGIVCFFPAICAVLEILCFIPYGMKFKHREHAEDPEVVAAANNIELVENLQNA